MKRFDVQGIDLQATQRRAFSYIADPMHLPQWTSAFASVANGRAVMRTPGGKIIVIDGLWTLRFGNGGNGGNGGLGGAGGRQLNQSWIGVSTSRVDVECGRIKEAVAFQSKCGV